MNELKKLSPTGLIFILSLMNLFNYFNRHFLSAVLTPVKNDLILSDGQLGGLASTLMLGYTFACPFWGYFGDKFSRKWLIVIGALLWAFSTFAIGFVHSFIFLLFSQVLVGVGQSAFTAIAPSMIADMTTKEKRNSAFTVYYIAIPLGSAFSFLIGGFLSHQIGWRYAFIVSAIPTIILALLFYLFKMPPMQSIEMNINSEESHLNDFNVREMFKLFKIRDYNLNAWGYTAYHFALGALAFWGPTFVSRNFSVLAHNASILFGAVLVAAGLLGTLAGGLLANWWQKRKSNGYAWVCATSLYLAAPLSLMAFWSTHVYLCITLTFITMFLAFLPTGPINTLIIETSPTHLRSSGMALSMFMIHIFGDMWSPKIVGALADYANGRLEIGLSVLSFAFLAAAILWNILAIKQKRLA